MRSCQGPLRYRLLLLVLQVLAFLQRCCCRPPMPPLQHLVLVLHQQHLPAQQHLRPLQPQPPPGVTQGSLQLHLLLQQEHQQHHRQQSLHLWAPQLLPLLVQRTQGLPRGVCLHC